MFTGIVQTTAAILNTTPTDTGLRLTVQRGALRGEVAHGDSICVSGVCLTAVEITDKQITFDVIHETLSKTKVGLLTVGDTVNLEPAVTASQPMGGHFMQGHVDGLAVIDAIDTDNGVCRITLKATSAEPGKPPSALSLKRDGQCDQSSEDLMDYMIPRGSVAIDGVSLTLARVADDSFDVALIPATLELTTLGNAKVGDRVNIEADILTKTIAHQLNRMRDKKPGAASGVTTDLLREAGFAD